MLIERVFKRHFHVVVLVLVATAAYFQARGVAQLARMALGSVPDSSTGANPSPRAATTVELKRGQDTLAMPNPDMSDPLSWPACEGVQVLIVTESSDPWWSMTTVRESAGLRPRLRRVGDDVAGKQVAFIGYNPKQQTPSVWLQGKSAVCQSVLFAQQPRVAEVPKLSDAELDVDRSVVEKALGDPVSVMGPVRIRPERKDGKVIGLRLLGIRPGTVLGTLGLQNGDRLESINGFDVTSPEKALEAYAHLRTAKRLSVHLSRLGRPLEINLNIN